MLRVRKVLASMFPQSTNEAAANAFDDIANGRAWRGRNLKMQNLATAKSDAELQLSKDESSKIIINGEPLVLNGNARKYSDFLEKQKINLIKPENSVKFLEQFPQISITSGNCNF